MSGKGRGRIYEPDKGKILVYVPSSVSRDTSFPFQKGDNVLVKIENNKLIIEPYNNDNQR